MLLSVLAVLMYCASCTLSVPSLPSSSCLFLHCVITTSSTASSTTAPATAAMMNVAVGTPPVVPADGALAVSVPLPLPSVLLGCSTTPLLRGSEPVVSVTTGLAGGCSAAVAGGAWPCRQKVAWKSLLSPTQERHLQGQAATQW